MAIAGAGMQIRVLPRTQFNYGSQIIVGQSLGPLLIGQHVEVGDFTEVDMVVRLHAGTIGTGASVLVFMRTAAKSQMSPGNSSFVKIAHPRARTDS